MPNSTSVDAVAGDQRDRRRQERQQVDDAEAGEGIVRAAPAPASCRAGSGPTTVQSRARYSSANAITAAIFDHGEQQAELRVELRHRGQDHRQHVETMMATISRTKREPTEYGR